MIDRRRSAPLQLENAKKLESGQVRACQFRAGQVRACQFRAGQVGASQVRANQVRVGHAMVPPTLVAILCVMSPVRRLPMPDIAFRSAYRMAQALSCYSEIQVIEARLHRITKSLSFQIN